MTCSYNSEVSIRCFYFLYNTFITKLVYRQKRALSSLLNSKGRQYNVGTQWKEYCLVWSMIH